MSVEISLYAERFEEFIKSVLFLIDTVYPRVVSNRYEEMIGLRLLYEVGHARGSRMGRDEERRMSQWIIPIRDHPSIDYAMKFSYALRVGNYIQFGKLLAIADPLQWILIRDSLGGIREHTFHVFYSAYRSLPLEFMCKWMNFTDHQRCIDYCNRVHSKDSPPLEWDEDTMYFRRGEMI
jgi:hypothetical protein